MINRLAQKKICRAYQHDLHSVVIDLKDEPPDVQINFFNSPKN